MSMPRSAPPQTMRQHERRAQNRTEEEGAFDLHTAYAGIDMLTNPAIVDWSRAIHVEGYETVQLLIDYTKGGGTTALLIAVETSYQAHETDTLWYERQILDPTDEVTFMDGSPLSYAGATGRVCIELPANGVWMRFKPYAETSGVGARCSVKAIRRMLAM